MARDWKPHPGPQTKVLQCLEDEVGYGGARGGGKTDAGLAWLLYDIQNPKLRALVIRKTGEDLSDWIDRAGQFYGRIKGLTVEVVGRPAEIRFSTGAIIRTGHLRDDNAYEKYQGHEYHRMLIEELTQIPNEERYLKLISSCRSSSADLKPQVFTTTNPGGVGHAWVKKRFVDVAPPGQRYTDADTGRTRIFIPAKVTDNPTLMENDPTYVRFLDGLPGQLRDAWRDGRWDLFVGQFFAEFEYDVHVVSRSTKVEDWWPRFGAYDHGFNHPFCFGWYACDGDGNVYKYRELLDRYKRPDQIAEMVHSYSDTKLLKYIEAGHDCWSRQKDGGMTIAEQFLNMGSKKLVLNQAKIDRKQGAAQVRDYLAHTDLIEGRTGPRFFIFEDCIRTIECLPRMIHDDHDIEDVKKVDATEEDMFGGDDAYDETRYALMSRPRIAVEPKEPYAFNTFGWMREEHERAKKVGKRRTMIKRSA